MAVVAKDEYKSPVLAFWQSGLGRVLSYTGEVDGKFTGPIGDWDRIGDFLTSQARWTAGIDQPLPPDMLVVGQIHDDVQMVRLYLDPQRQGEAFKSMPQVHALSGRPGLSPEKITRAMHWATPRYS